MTLTNDNETSSEYVKLVSAEGDEFYADREVITNGSKTIETMLEGGRFRESCENLIRFPEISTRILEKVLQYMYFKYKYSANINNNMPSSTNRIPDFQIEPEIALELLVASSYLDC